jgi:hypothetical protein
VTEQPHDPHPVRIPPTFEEPPRAREDVVVRADGRHVPVDDLPNQHARHSRGTRPLSVLLAIVSIASRRVGRCALRHTESSVFFTSAPGCARHRRHDDHDRLRPADASRRLLARRQGHGHRARPAGTEENPYFETPTFTPVGDVTYANEQVLVGLLAGGRYVARTGPLVLKVEATVDSPDWGIVQSPFMRDKARTSPSGIASPSTATAASTTRPRSSRSTAGASSTPTRTR